MDFPQQLEACVKQANQALSRFIAPLPFQNTPVVETMQYGALLGGKRLRPFLVYATGHMFGVSTNTLDAPAAAVECIHAYSLIHDDLPAMDNDDLRRGVPTNHKVYGEALAILAGDGLLTSAFEAMNKDLMLYLDDANQMAKRIRAINAIAKGAGCRGMVAGQVSDIEGENNEYSNEMLEYIHINKTGALIISAIKAGLYLGNPTKDMLSNLDIYSENLGLAYQIADDILDEIGDLDPSCQVKLLRVLQDQTFEVLGDSRPRKTDIRVVSATNADLRKMVGERTFREDLFYRINLITVRLPALRERREDIPLLARHFADRQAEANGFPRTEFSADALQFLSRLPYPGNIRELKNLVERTILVNGKPTLDAADFDAQYIRHEDQKVAEGASFAGMTLDEIERQTILQALERHKGNLSQVATALGISRAALYRRLEKFGISV